MKIPALFFSFFFVLISVPCFAQSLDCTGINNGGSGGGIVGASLANGKILVGNSANQAAAVFPSGDLSITNAGVFDVLTNNNGNAFGTLCAANFSSNALSFTGTSDTFAAPLCVGTCSGDSGVQFDLSANTGSMLLPIGASSARPGTGVNGMLRYNSGTNFLEGYINSNWTPIATQLNSPGIAIGTSSLSGSNIYVYADQTSNPQIEAGEGGAASNFALSISGGRGMIGYDNTNTVAGVTGNMVLNAGVGHGFYFDVNGTNNSFISGTTEMVVNSSGVTVGTAAFATGGTLTVNGGITQTTAENCAAGVVTNGVGLFSSCVASDGTLKTDIQDLPYDPSVIGRLRPVSYAWIDKATRDDKTHMGFIAQDIQKVIPNAVVSGGKDLLAIDPSSMIAALTLELQHQRKEIDDLKFYAQGHRCYGIFWCAE